MTMQQVVVTGGGGFIGGAIVQQLCRDGLQVRVVGRNTYPHLEEIGVRCLQGDIGDLEFLQHAFSGADTVFHVAAKAGVWGDENSYRRANVIGTENVIKACRHNRVPVLVYTSTPSVVFDQHDLEGCDESLAYASRPMCHYAASKIEAEKLVLTANGQELSTTAIRPHLVWGPGDRHLIPRLLERGKAGSLKIVGTGTNRVDISYIDNVVHAHILAAENLHGEKTAGGEAFFIGQKEPVVLWQWVNDLFDRVGVRPIRSRVSFAKAYIAGMVLEAVYGLLRIESEPKMTRFVAHQLAQSHWFDHSKAERILGYREQVSTEQGLDRLVEWIGSGISLD